MLSKVVLFLFSFLSNPQQNQLIDHELKIMTLFKNTLRTEVFYIGFKLLIGVILTSVAVFSLIQVGISLQIYLSLFENGNVLVMICFTSITLLSLILIYLLFKKELTTTESDTLKKSEPSNEISFVEIGSKFIEGLVRGYSK